MCVCMCACVYVCMCLNDVQLDPHCWQLRHVRAHYDDYVIIMKIIEDLKYGSGTYDYAHYRQY